MIVNRGAFPATDGEAVVRVVYARLFDDSLPEKVSAKTNGLEQ